ncbi:MAG: hypothetical protein AVDCRST_MAG43-388 [uncultured Thermomicrobiales bacterium]|uniref:Uncharacterized protein n=1 Tax=uncultured Thermomicrobiales bacterium TaxID=1645740 RepID=A0A6J4U972_9BACT|nr:MAG: hypothetical protein AVDCRST_MAG43-388 [uncultured Thermomicrobiales bacterium]
MDRMPASPTLLPLRGFLANGRHADRPRPNHLAPIIKDIRADPRGVAEVGYDGAPGSARNSEVTRKLSRLDR